MRRRRNLRTCPDAFGAYGGTLRPLSAAGARKAGHPGLADRSGVEIDSI